MTFSAVVTTGIYCQPSCSARPNPENVRGFGSPAAAEAAGFRACLRCRPYRAADAVEGVGPELVCRAVHLIIDGALDDGTEEQLGKRLGVSPRHLRRMFAEHVGATPDQLARSRRAHFARRLLDDTDLTVTEIAFAAGFGSLRQCNRAIRQVFGAAPLALRARRRTSDRLVVDGGLALRLAVPADFVWSRQLGQLRRSAVAEMEHVTDDTYRRTIRVERVPGVIEVRSGGSGALRLTAHLPHWNGLIHVVDRVRRLLGLGMPAAAGSWDPFEASVRAVLGEWMSARCTTALLSDLVLRCGSSVKGLQQIGLTHSFPSARQVARCDLDAVGLGESRSATVRALARAVSTGRVRLDGSESRDDLVARLHTLPEMPVESVSAVASTLYPLQESRQ